MRGILLLFGALVLLGAAPLPRALTPLPAPAATAENPGTANLLSKHDAFGMACISCHSESPPARTVPTADCKSCHGSDDDIADLTDDKGADNPHASHNGPLPCEKCHHVHQPSTNFCGECHAGATTDVP